MLSRSGTTETTPFGTRSRGAPKVRPVLETQSYRRGAVVLVPFPFTDLSASKRRPALLWLNTFTQHGTLRAWKTFDWDAMDRLYERGLVSDPKSKAKSVVLTDEGRRACEEAFRKLLAA